jgi:ribosomal protein S18 acetylase RimI-like enzyme
MEIIDGTAYMPEVRALILEYTQRLGRDLSFQDLDDELLDPAQKYTLPAGEVLLALDEGTIVGMVAYHKISEKTCEMKRLYVKPIARRRRIGYELAKAIIKHATKAGYEEMVLDSLGPMKAAQELYRKLGFVECEPYYDNPMDDVIYMQKTLR